MAAGRAVSAEVGEERVHVSKVGENDAGGGQVDNDVLERVVPAHAVAGASDDEDTVK